MTNERPTTESILVAWRDGSTQAERMCGAILYAESYKDVDPQCPLGGPDGTKDILCRKDGKQLVAAVYFATTEKTFSQVQSKFKDDAKGVIKNNADGLVFLTNQRISPSERETLAGIVSPADCNLYHLDRIVTLLDSPIGYGIRLQFLRIPMTTEEQQALWSSLNYQLMRQLLSHKEELLNLNQKVDILLQQTSDRSGTLKIQEPSSLVSPETLIEIGHPTSQLNLGLLCWIHSIATDQQGIASSSSGKLRSIQVDIGPPGGPFHIPPAPEEVPGLTREFTSWWSKQHHTLVDTDQSTKIKGLAQFHHRFLSIHPFQDGNGRLSRILLDQASKELLGQKISLEIVSDLSKYFEALRSADNGDLSPLTSLVHFATL